MNLRLPSSGSLLESLISRLGASPMDSSGDATLADASEPELVAAMDAMARGHLEYVIIENSEEWPIACPEQAAGSHRRN